MKKEDDKSEFFTEVSTNELFISIKYQYRFTLFFLHFIILFKKCFCCVNKLYLIKFN